MSKRVWDKDKRRGIIFLRKGSIGISGSIYYATEKNNKGRGAVGENNAIRIAELKIVRKQNCKSRHKNNCGPKYHKEFAKIYGRIGAAALADLFQKDIHAQRPKIWFLQSI